MPSDRCSARARSATVPPLAGGAQHVGLPRGQRARPGRQRLRGQRRVDHPQPGVHPADRVGELPGRGVLDDEPARAGLHRPPQVAGPAERGDHQHPAAGHARPAAPRSPRSRPGRASRRRAAPRPARRRGPRRPPRRRGRPRPPRSGRAPATAARPARRGPAPGRRPAAAGSSMPARCTRSRNPVAPAAAAHGQRARPAASARSRSPRRPVPGRPSGAGSGPRPSSTISTWSGATRITRRGAPLCRTTLVTPSRTAQPNSSPPRRRHARRPRAGRSAVDARRGQRRPGAGQLPCQRDLAVRPDGAAHVGQRLPGQRLHVGDLGGRPVRVERAAAARPAPP